MPAVVALGYAASEGEARSPVDGRLPAEELFFDARFGAPITRTEVADYSAVLEAVRKAPSAFNRQPWRIVRTKDLWHLYLQRPKGFSKDSLLSSVLGIADLQRVGMGIAMCHFELVARERGLAGDWVLEDPGIKKPDERTEYTVSWRVGSSKMASCAWAESADEPA